MYGTVVRHGADDHKGRSNKMQVMKTEHILGRLKRHVMAIPVSAKLYIRKELLKGNRPQIGNKINELIDHFALLNQHEHLNNLEM